MEPKDIEILRCLYCSFTTHSAQELLDHEDIHTEVVEALEGIDGNEEEEDITGEEPEDEN
jgi:hypothetical protein